VSTIGPWVTHRRKPEERRPEQHETWVLDLKNEEGGLHASVMTCLSTARVHTERCEGYAASPLGSRDLVDASPGEMERTKGVRGRRLDLARSEGVPPTGSWARSVR
jgi:hypothetical protein